MSNSEFLRLVRRNTELPNVPNNRPPQRRERVDFDQEYGTAKRSHARRMAQL